MNAAGIEGIEGIEGIGAMGAMYAADAQRACYTSGLLPHKPACSLQLFCHCCHLCLDHHTSHFLSPVAYVSAVLLGIASCFCVCMSVISSFVNLQQHASIHPSIQFIQLLLWPNHGTSNSVQAKQASKVDSWCHALRLPATTGVPAANKQPARC
jgi:hypothetical protein